MGMYGKVIGSLHLLSSTYIMTSLGIICTSVSRRSYVNSAKRKTTSTVIPQHSLYSSAISHALLEKYTHMSIWHTNRHTMGDRSTSLTNDTASASLRHSKQMTHSLSSLSKYIHLTIILFSLKTYSWQVSLALVEPRGMNVDFGKLISVLRSHCRSRMPLNISICTSL